MFYQLVAFITGIIVSLMVLFNTKLAEFSSLGFSLIINQIVAIILIGLYLAFTKKWRAKLKKTPWYLFLGGCFAIFIMGGNYYSVINIGLTVNTANMILGQIIGSLIIDTTGFAGKTKHPFNFKKIPAILICLIAILIMVIGFKSSSTHVILPVIVGIIVGILNVTQMVVNSRLSDHKGLLPAALINVLVGFSVITTIFLIIDFNSTILNFKTVFNIPFIYLVGGGFLGIFVVVGSSFSLSHLSSLYGSLILSAGSIIFSVLLDYSFGLPFNTNLIIGAFIILFALYIDMRLNKEKKIKA